MNQEQSEILALQALAYITGDEKTLNWLISETGVSPADIGNVQDPNEVLAGVLDFLLAHEEILVEFCTQQNIPPTNPARARRFLPGAVMEDY
ncbi:DUF3572 domain-containing protein [Sneathiella marina]|uniref:DUF3572 domain-containing protein n=1 Tax=Sneathiella marina TaxID=2950108 RepID=A0ABY4VZ51_9PROT|nr:DUF3572 domain-containing protein [Sneathiella marina]USG60150.1 DUF3572 domain-containing protein [Sneathiella marina]